MRLIIFDGNSILNRAFYGIRPLTTKDGIPTNAAFGFVKMIEKNLESAGNVDYAAVAFDMRAKTFRHKMYDGYKAKRKGMPEELAAQLPYAKQLAEGLGLKILECEGYEADDILGTVSVMSSHSGVECIIVTGDRDSFQLIDENTRVFFTSNNDTKVYDKARINDEYGMEPKQLIDLKSVMGDSSDNIPGVPGIGEKGASELILEYGTLENVYANISSVKPALAKKLISGKESAYMSMSLARICTEVPLVHGLEEMKYKGSSPQLLVPLYTKLEFRALLDRLDAEPAQVRMSDAVEEAKDVKDEYEMSDVSRAEEMAKKEELFLHIENGICFVSAAEESISFVLDEDCRTLFENKNNRICVWSKKETKHILWQENIEFMCCSDDISLLGYCVAPADNGVVFEKLVLMFLGVSCSGIKPSLFGKLRDKMREQAEKNSQMQLYKEIEMPLASVLAGMERIGFKVDKAGLLDYGKDIAASLGTAEGLIYAAAGRSFNINSPKQLGQVLYEEMGLPHTKKTKTGYSTNAEVLEKLRFSHPDIIEPILYHRQLSKLKGTYADGLIKVISPDTGRIHTTFKQTQTLTGRLSSVEPNLQNIPVRTELGRELRRFFGAGEGKVLIDADYSQIELRVLAHASQDEGLIEAFIAGEDIHTVTASQVFGVDMSEVTPEMRKRAKAVNFGIVYGIGEFSLAEDLKISRSEAREYIDGYFAKFPKIKVYMDQTIAFASENGYVTTVFGRRRYVPELSSPKKQIQAFGKRVAMNTPIQGSAADIIKKAMIDVDRALREENLDSRLVLQVHDELIVEAPVGEKNKAASILKEKMESAVKMSVPLTVDLGIGNTWYEAKEQ